MAMHEFEALADGLILVLDESPDSEELDLRSMYAAIANFVGSWDASLQHFHVLEQVLHHRYTYAFPIEEHPDYNDNKEYFDNLHGYENIFRQPAQEWDEETNPEVGIYCHPEEEWGDYDNNIPEELLNKGMLYFNAGGELWQRFVDAGKLTGKDALPPVEIPLEEIILTALKAAVLQEEDAQLISIAYALMPSYAITNNPTALMQNAAMHEIRDIVMDTDACRYNNDYGYSELPSLEQLEDYNELGIDRKKMPEMAAFADWWYAPLKTYYTERVTTPEYWMHSAHTVMKAINEQRMQVDDAFWPTGQAYAGLPEEIKAKLPSEMLPSWIHARTTQWEQYFSKAELSAMTPLITTLKNLSDNIREKAVEAISYFDKSLELAPDNWMALYNRGLCFIELQQAPEAMDSFNIILSTNPDSDYAYLGIGLCELMAEHQELAKEAIAKALALNPDNQDARAYYAYMWEQQ
jgi:tetratricopeptide (TPR) repeat protein